MNIKIPEGLVTFREQTRTGFILFALEKNRRSTPVIESTKSFKILLLNAKAAKSLLKISEIRNALLTVSGLSDKALNYFKDKAVLSLIKKFLEPCRQVFCRRSGL
ncbi:hypothetical protein ATZ36_08305 [Candidatus Endomicrobiellum trichonymphae]|uniref:Uncharacterized protein n=1 Tax=Endomicrobium trichonymphae TaxID=1408204 RepID=A0A1E5IGT3_ENDTX|nr:hypothetical protein ATZ36_08305 [Candidatus Endomicrobium trichonymphae]